MATKHVHWWDGDIADEHSGSPYIPPPPRHPTSARTAPDDDDLLDDSPLPLTPPMLGQVTQARRSVRDIPPVQISASSILDPGTSLFSPSRHVGHASPRSDPYRMAAMIRSLPPASPVGLSSHKSPASESSRRTPRDSVGFERLHPLLIFKSDRASPTIVWDFRNRPRYDTVLMTTADNGGKLVPVPPSILNQPATNPPQRWVRVHCVGHALWEPLLLRVGDIQTSPAADSRQIGRAKPSAPGRQAPANSAEFICFKDVILGIYNYLQIRMTQAEYDALAEKPTPGLQDAVANSFYQRCEAEELQALSLTQERGIGQEANITISPLRVWSRINTGANSARSGGLRRLDCLLGQTRFLGLAPVPGSSHDWFVKL